MAGDDQGSSSTVTMDARPFPALEDRSFQQDRVLKRIFIDQINSVSGPIPWPKAKARSIRALAMTITANNLTPTTATQMLTKNRAKEQLLVPEAWCDEVHVLIVHPRLLPCDYTDSDYGWLCILLA